MSNYYPAGRLYQKLMIALDPSAKCVAISGPLTAGATPSNVKALLKADYLSARNKYPNYTAASFAEMLDQVNMFQIIGVTGGATYKFDSSTDSSSILAPVENQGGVYFHGQENFNSLYIAGSGLTIAHIALFIKPTP